MYGIVYKILTTVFQIYFLTLKKLPLDENNFELFNNFIMIHQWIVGLAHAFFRLYGTSASTLFNH